MENKGNACTKRKDKVNATAKEYAARKEVADIVIAEWRKGKGRMAIRQVIKDKLQINAWKASRLMDEVYKTIERNTEKRIVCVKEQMLEICHTQLSKLLAEEGRQNNNMILKYIDMIAKLHNIYAQPNIQQQNIITFKFGDEPITNNNTEVINEQEEEQQEDEITDVEFNFEEEEDGSERI